MSDRHLRTLERKFKESDAIEDLARWVKERTRCGYPQMPPVRSLISWKADADFQLRFRIVSDLEDRIVATRPRCFFWILALEEKMVDKPSTPELVLVHTPGRIARDIGRIISDRQYGDLLFALDDGYDLRIQVTRRGRLGFPEWNLIPARDPTSIPEELRPLEDLEIVFGLETELAYRSLDRAWSKFERKLGPAERSRKKSK